MKRRRMWVWTAEEGSAVEVCLVVFVFSLAVGVFAYILIAEHFRL